MTRTCRLSLIVMAFAVLAVTPAAAESFLVFTQGGIPPGADLCTWCDAGQPCDIDVNFDCDTPEGGTSRYVNTNLWGGWGVFLNDTNPDPGCINTVAQPEDLSAFSGGEMRFWVKAPKPDVLTDVKVEFQCDQDMNNDGTNDGYLKLLSEIDSNSDGTMDWDGDGSTWQEFSVPLSDFTFDGTAADTNCFQNILSPFLITIADLPAFNSFYVDYVRWVNPSPAHAGATSVTVQGRDLLVNGAPFAVNGYAYAPVGIGENWQGAWSDRPDRYLVDFPLISAGGANTVRLYAPILTTAMLDAAWTTDIDGDGTKDKDPLYVIPSFGVDNIQLTCPEGRAFMKDRFVEMVQKWKNHPAILFWLVGNEVNRSGTCSNDPGTKCSNNQDCSMGGTCDGPLLCEPDPQNPTGTAWYTQLNDMAAAAQSPGGSLHPVGTAEAELDDICVDLCSDDTALPDVDLWGTQIYRGCSFGTLFNEYEAKNTMTTPCGRPLIITEFGSDAFDGTPPGPGGVEDETMQADCLEDLLAEANQEYADGGADGTTVNSGQVIFEWADEWWKATCGTGEWDVQDDCASFTNNNYPDPEIHEEWWGVAELDNTDPNNRTTRTAYTRVAERWPLGAACNLEILTYNPGSGDTTISFDPAYGSTDHTLYYGPLSAVSTYGYSGFESGLGITGSSTVTLSGGSLFMLIAPKNAAEGCYGKDSELNERNCYPDGVTCSLPQAVNRTCECGP